MSSRLVLALAFATICQAQTAVSFATTDAELIDGLMYGKGNRGVVLAHGGRFKKESWHEQAKTLADAGFLVLAFDFRRGERNRDYDVIGAARFLESAGAKSLALIGASMGGDYAARASESHPTMFHRVILLAAGAYTPLVESRGRKLFIMTRDDVIGDNKPRVPAIRAQYDRASDPKQFVLLEGSAHAQAIFQSPDGHRLMKEILRFLR